MRRPVSKYRAKRTTVDGVTFHSMKEAARYKELKLLEKAGEISELRLQPAFCLNALGIDGSSVGIYRADFSYIDKRQNTIVEDVKGYDTPLSRWKRKHVECQYGITVQII